MQGYILNTVKVKDEDLIVSLLTQNSLKTVYRFYGARHATINLGYKIDFEIERSPRSTIGMLRQVLHLSSPWLIDYHKFYLWQHFCKLLYQHLRDVEALDSFYFEMLDTAANKMKKQNPKRVLIESYLDLLDHEGRLHRDFTCFLCNQKVEEEVVLARGLLPVHPHCLSGKVYTKTKVNALFQQRNTLFLEDEEIDALWCVIEEGL